MKTNAVIFVGLIVNVCLSAQTAVSTLPPVEVVPASWTLTTSGASQYMFRGTRRGGPALQPSIEYDAGGLGLGLWSNVPLKNKVVGQSDPEFDFYGFYSMDLTNAMVVVPGFTLYTYPDARKNNGFYKATFEPSLALNYTLGGFRLTPKLYYDFVLKGPTAELTTAFAVPLKDFGTELDFTAAAGTFIWRDYAPATNPEIKNWGDYYIVGVTAPFQISKDSKITIGWAYTKGSGNYLKPGAEGKVSNSAAVGRGVLTISYTFTF